VRFSRPLPSPTRTTLIRISPRRSAAVSSPSTSRRRCARSSTATTASFPSPTRIHGRWCARSPRPPARPTTRRLMMPNRNARLRRWRRSNNSSRQRSSSNLPGRGPWTPRHRSRRQRPTPSAPRARAGAGGARGEPPLHAHSLRKEPRAGQPVLKDVSLTVEGRGTTAIIEPSGIGKSTLTRCINRLVDPTAGEILFRREDLARLNGRQLRLARRRMGMVFQEYNLVERLSVIENVLCGRLGYVPVWRAWLRKFPAQDVERAFHLLDAVGLGDLATQRADQLSGGQRQRVGIA